MVIGRNEETGQSGVFPVTALMSRTAAEVIWLTLEDGSGKTTRMGVTSEHPMFMAGRGWTRAGDITPGDAIRDKDLAPLTVLAVELDDRPTLVHNLEIAEAHTYFAGELEAWGHNATKPLFSPPLQELKTVAQKLLKKQGGCISNTQLEYIACKAAMFGVSSDEVGDDRTKPHWKPKGTPARHCHLFGSGKKGHIPMTQQ